MRNNYTKNVCIKCGNFKFKTVKSGQIYQCWRCGEVTDVLDIVEVVSIAEK